MSRQAATLLPSRPPLAAASCIGVEMGATEAGTRLRLKVDLNLNMSLNLNLNLHYLRHLC